jgi:hypothetical protein
MVKRGFLCHASTFRCGRKIYAEYRPKDFASFVLFKLIALCRCLLQSPVLDTWFNTLNFLIIYELLSPVRSVLSFVTAREVS